MVEAVPAEGYSLESVKANGVTAVDGQFTVTRATEVVARFTVTSGIDDKQETVLQYQERREVYM